MAQKPSIPKGTRDFSPAEMMRRTYIFETVKSVFRTYGFAPLETPAMENLSTLLGKYGDEGDKLLFKILNSGDYAAGLADAEVRSASRICEKGLRYDLTVPFARYVVQHQGEITFPFKRYQIQPVWRADRPQKGRYREFYQCDADVVGSESLNNEIELVQLIDAVFCDLGINITVKLNNRKILAGIAEAVGHADKLVDITVAIDKIDKIGLENVNAELLENGISAEAVEKLQPVLTMTGSNAEKLDLMADMLRDSETGMKGVAEMREVIEGVEDLGHKCTVEVDLSLARGLNYYTGTILEVKANDVQMGSITGGGRYDNLTGVFGMPGLSGVGISFGADRIYDVLGALDLYPAGLGSGTTVLFANFGEESAAVSTRLVKALRAKGVSAEVYPDEVKMKKQIGYANNTSVPFFAMIGDDELAAQKVTVKNMATGEQTQVPFDEITEFFAK